MATEKGWAIVGRCGLYVDWRLTRTEMIAKHVHDLTPPDHPEVSQFAIGGRLDEAQRRIWESCQKNGDRAVKVTISYALQ